MELYPFEGGELLRKCRSLKKKLREAPCSQKLRIAVLGGSTTNHIADMLEVFLLSYGISPEIYQCEYGQYYEDLKFNSEALRKFAPDYVYLHTTWRNIREFPVPSDSPEAVEEKLGREVSRLTECWKIALDTLGAAVIQNNFDYPPYRLFGNRDCFDHRGRVNFVLRLNEAIASFAGKNKGFYVNDINYLSAAVGLDRWNDTAAWNMYKYSPAPEAIPELAYNVSAIIKSVQGKNKKAIVLDLDNTLWGGVVGDDGVEGIEIGSETPQGEVYREFQQYLAEVRSLGILLTVNSKNDYENAIAGLSHPQSVLKPELFTDIKANWLPKDRNIQQIAKDLNIGIDSLLFVDDNPAEREIVARLDAGISIPPCNAPEDFIRILDRGRYFEVTSFSDDDLRRNEMYKANADRRVLEESTGNYEEYLRALEMKASIRPFEEIYLQRIAQLTNKSNQFNLTTRRYTLNEIREVSGDPQKITLYGALRDKFGDNGVVSLIIGEREGDRLAIVLWLMSCRVLKRGLENAMLDELVLAAQNKGIDTLVGRYIPSAKNGMVREFYRERGFTLKEELPGGETVWELRTEGYEPQNRVIEII